MRLAGTVARGMVVGSILGFFGAVSPAQAEVSTIHATPVVDSGIASYVPKPGVSGGIAIAGSDTMQPIIAKIVESSITNPHMKHPIPIFHHGEK